MLSVPSKQCLGKVRSPLTWSRLFFWGARRGAKSGLISIAARALETGATSSKSSFSGTALSRTGHDLQAP